MIFDAHVTKNVLGYGDDSGHSGYLTFDQVDIDIGEAFDGSFFTAPITGIYKMTFSGQNAMSDIDHTSISVYKNDNLMFGIMDFNVAVEWGDNVSYTSWPYISYSSRYRPLPTAVFSCFHILPPTNNMKGAKNGKIGKSRKKLQFY